MVVDLPPVTCSYCAKDEHHLARHDIEPCDCAAPRCAKTSGDGDDPFLTAAARCQQIAERRFDKQYDEQSPATIYMPNGSKVASFDRAFCGAATREALALHDEQRAST